MVSGKSTAAVKLALGVKNCSRRLCHLVPKIPFRTVIFSGHSSAGARSDCVHLAQVVRVAHGVGSFWVTLTSPAFSGLVDAVRCTYRWGLPLWTTSSPIGDVESRYIPHTGQ